MPAATANTCRMVIGNVENGIISAQGFHASFPASMWPRFESHTAVAGRPETTTHKENLMYIPQLEAIILKPDISLHQTMVVTTDYTTTGGTWSADAVYGNPTLTLAHQKNTTAKTWLITSTASFAANQGFMVWWNKFATPSGSSPDFWVELSEAVNNTGLYVKIYPSSKIELSYLSYDIATDVLTTETKEVTLPLGLSSSEFQLKTLIVLFVGRDIVVGIDNLDNAQIVRFSKYKYTPETATVSAQYMLTDGTETLKVSGDGAILCGFKKLTYATSGGFTTPLYYPGYIMATPPAAEKKAVIPTGTTLTIEGFGGGSDITTEAVTASDAEKQGVYFNTNFTGTGNITPIYYSASVRQAPTRISMSSAAQELTADILEFNQSVSGSKDGSFSGSNISALVSCETQFYPNIFMARSPKVAYYLTFISQSAEVLRDTHFIDIKEAQRPEFGEFLLQINSRDITKELELTPLMESIDFDSQIKAGSWKHINLMDAFASYAGVALTTTAADYASDPLLPYSTDENKAMWQYQRNANLWECMQRLREYSGWLLYPNTSGNLIYKPRPTTATTPDYTWDANTIGVEGIRYKLIDLYRTRFLVWGKAANDNTGTYPYKKADNILGAGYHEGLENQLGRSRVLIVLDPSLADWDSIKRMVDALYDYYTKDGFYLSFNLTYPELYPNLWLYQVIDWSDSVMEWNGEAIANKKFMITSLNFRYAASEGSCQVEAFAL